MIADFKRKQKKNISGKILLAIAGVLILFFSVSLLVADIKIYKKKKELAYQVEKLENKIQDIQSQNDNLKQKISEAEDNEYIEKIAREELDLQKQGEKVFSFITPETEELKTEPVEKDFWQEWLGWISSIFSRD